jgi:hypothetical protein
VVPVELVLLVVVPVLVVDEVVVVVVATGCVAVQRPTPNESAATMRPSATHFTTAGVRAHSSEAFRFKRMRAMPRRLPPNDE